MIPKYPDNTRAPPFETDALREKISEFYETPFFNPITKLDQKVGNFVWGVYAFFDYDDQPIYVGQTYESLRDRIGRHLTGQRSDPVSKSILDPFEVHSIEVWPLPQFESVNSKTSEKAKFTAAKTHLAALEHQIYNIAISESLFGEILNEKKPATPQLEVQIPDSLRKTIVSDEVYKLRGHPDFRIFRRAQVMARLSEGIAGRKVQPELRLALVTQSKRLLWLAERRLDALTEATRKKKGGENGEG